MTGTGLPADAERALALAYAPAAARPALAALWALDETLGGIVRATRQPLVGQMRLTWWHEALCRLDSADAPEQPVLVAVKADLLPRGPSGEQLAGMIDGWEVLIDEAPLSNEALETFAEARGAALFEAAGQVLGARGDPLAAAGRGWALVDLAFHLSDRAAAEQALALARPALAAALAPRWRPAGRPIGMLAALAAVDARRGLDRPRTPGAPQRMARMFLHRIGGR